MIKDNKSKSGFCGLFSGKFLISVIILLFSAIGLRPVIAALSEYYQKESIAVRRPLSQFDFSKLRSFQDGWVRENIEISVKDVGTEEFLNVRFNKSDGTKNQSIILFVTYYSDPHDKVAHTPDVCARQSGSVMKKMTTITLDIPELEEEYGKIKVRLLLFNEPKYNVNSVYLYVLFVSDRFKVHRDLVRWEIYKPGDKYVFFSKIESFSVYKLHEDPDDAIENCKQMLREAIPVLLRDHFPTRNQLKRH